MKKLIDRILSSKELKDVTALAISSIMTALNVVLGFFTVQPNEFLKIGFGFVPLSLVGMLYGPVAGGLAGIAGDLLKFAIRPTGPYFIGFTISGFLTGFLYGLFFYRQRITLVRAAFAQLTVSLFIHVMLNSVWLNLLFGTPIVAMLPTRLFKNAILFPIEVGIIYSVSRVIEKIMKRSGVSMK
ncbi:MAG: folate family ECF transporter S component [Acetanaerobacterium sp.]